MEATPASHYILDEEYRVVMACRSTPEDPLNRFYDSASRPDALPSIIENAVRRLTARWERRSERFEASTLVEGVRVTAASLHGRGRRHIMVVAESLKSVVEQGERVARF